MASYSLSLSPSSSLFQSSSERSRVLCAVRSGHQRSAFSKPSVRPLCTIANACRQSHATAAQCPPLPLSREQETSAEALTALGATIVSQLSQHCPSTIRNSLLSAACIAALGVGSLDLALPASARPEVIGETVPALHYMDLRFDTNGDIVFAEKPYTAPSLLTASAPTLTPTAAPVAVSPAATSAAPAQGTSPLVPGAPAAATAPAPPTSTPGSSASQAAPSSTALAAAPRVPAAGPLPAWLNELHYDNIGVDEGEFVEIATRPGVNPDDITVALYNGTDGKIYNSFKLSKFTPGSKIAGFAVYSLILPSNGIQNGPADGVAIFQKAAAGEKVIQFVSYEGELVATEGAAKGFRSLDIGVAQNDKTPKGSSLGLTGKGNDYKDFKWGTLSKATPGSLNPGQSIGL